MIDKHVQRLQELNARTRSGDQGRRNAGNGFGRYDRKPDYTAPSVKGTRPRSDRGVTFHFKHTFVSKKNSVSTGYRNETSASAHQDYIERPGAAEEWDGRDDQRGPISFGTLGDTKAERSEFWRKVERAEGRRARVQCRMIVELPHELDASGRATLAQDFCKSLEDEGMPYWCVLHAPDAKNDSRNYHMHIAYLDRPARKMDDGRWDFEVTEEVRGSNRVTRQTRPYKQNKPRHTQGPKWIRHLRRAYSDVANAHLSLADCEKRYDPRSYDASGVPKTPTLHMGTKRAHAESQGLDTRAGVINSRREMSYRLASSETEFMGKAARMETRRKAFKTMVADLTGEDAKVLREAVELCQKHQDLSREAIQVSRKKSTHSLAAEAVAERLERRLLYLDREGEKLITRPPRRREAAALDASAKLFEEYDLARDAHGDIAPFALDCRRVSEAQDRRLSRIRIEQTEIENRVQRIEKQFLRTRHQDLEPEAFEQMLEARDTTMSVRSQLAPAIKRAMDNATRHEPVEQPDLELGGQAAASELKKAEEARDPKPPRPAEENTAGPSPIPGFFRPGRRDEDQEKTEDAENRATGFKTDSVGGAFADAMRLSARATESDVSTFDARLAEMTNRDLRRTAFATRDGADLSADEAAQGEFTAALAVIKRHAARRGLDLDSGIHRPERATDAKLATRHTDSVKPASGERWWDPHVRTRG